MRKLYVRAEESGYAAFDEPDRYLEADESEILQQPCVARLRDLVRHQRGALHDAELITDQEYAALAADHGAVARLEKYDAQKRVRLLPLDAEGWKEKLVHNIIQVLFEAKKTKHLDTGSFSLAVRTLVLVQEALDAQGAGIQAGRKEQWADNAYAILQMIREKRGLPDRSLPDIDHMFEMIERPPTTGTYRGEDE